MAKRQYRLIFFLLGLLSVGLPLHAGVLDTLERLGGKKSFGEAREFLDPEDAFRLSHTVKANRVVRLRWEIAPGYYLYRDKMTATSESSAVTVADLRRPAGTMKEDPEFGRVAIYRDSVAIDAGLHGGAAVPETVAIKIGYQGCAEDAICYPPITKSLLVSLAESAVPRAEAADAVVPAVAPSTVATADNIARQLRGGSLVAIAGAFFVFGLLLAFTPCVLPMVPILSGIIVGEGRRLSLPRSILFSAVYVFAVAVTYAVVGLIAGLFGHNLQAAFQQPVVIIVFSMVFVALAMSMFGYYELQLPSRLQTYFDQRARRHGGGKIIGVAAMGVLSAIIVGPCVAPPLAGALLYLSDHGSPVIGAVALFALGLGMGTPLLLVGASAGSLLPRAGAWMEAVKRVFGVMLLGVAIWFLGRILPGPLTLVLWALLCIISAVYLGALDSLSSGSQALRRLAKGVGVAMLCYGLVLIIGASAGADDPLRPLRPLSERGAYPASARLAFTAIKGVAGLDAGLARARTAGRPVLVDFYADWCVECKHLERETFQDPTVAAALSEMILLRADVTANDADDRRLLQRFDLFGPPALLFFAPSGEEHRRHRVVGFVGPSEFTAHLASLEH